MERFSAWHDCMLDQYIVLRLLDWYRARVVAVWTPQVQWFHSAITDGLR